MSRLARLWRGLAVAVAIGVVNGAALAALVWVAVQRYWV